MGEDVIEEEVGWMFVGFVALFGVWCDVGGVFKDDTELLAWGVIMPGGEWCAVGRSSGLFVVNVGIMWDGKGSSLLFKNS